MSDKDREVVNSFSKEILDLCNKYVLLGISKIELCTIILNVYTGLFIGLTLEAIFKPLGIIWNKKEALQIENK